MLCTHGPACLCVYLYVCVCGEIFIQSSCWIQFKVALQWLQPDMISATSAVSACEQAEAWTNAVELLTRLHEDRKVFQTPKCLGRRSRLARKASSGKHDSVG